MSATSHESSAATPAAKPRLPGASGAAQRALGAVKDAKLSERQKKAVEAGQNAVIGTLANLAIAACAGLIGGRIHPLAPQILYSLMATGSGIYIAERNSTVGNLLTAGGMVAGGSLVMRGTVTLFAPLGVRDVPTDAFNIADRVGRTVAANATQAPTPVPTAATTVAPTAAPPYMPAGI